MRKYGIAIALTLAVALVIYPVARAGEITAATALGGAGLVFLIASLTWQRGRALSVVAIIFIALHYTSALHAAHLGVDYYSVLFALGLFLLHEASDLSIDLADTAPLTSVVVTRRLGTTLVTGTAGGVLSTLLLLARSLLSPSVTGLLVGIACTGGLIGLVLATATLGGGREMERL